MLGHEGTSTVTSARASAENRAELFGESVLGERLRDQELRARGLCLVTHVVRALRLKRIKVPFGFVTYRDKHSHRTKLAE